MVGVVTKNSGQHSHVIHMHWALKMEKTVKIEAPMRRSAPKPFPLVCLELPFLWT